MESQWPDPMVKLTPEGVRHVRIAAARFLHDDSVRYFINEMKHRLLRDILLATDVAIEHAAVERLRIFEDLIRRLVNASNPEVTE